jgi:1,4-alpha-glucan branching enzyme
VSLPAAIGYALAATLAGFLIRGALPSNKSTQVAVTAPMEARAPSTSPAVKTVAGTNAIRESQEAPVAVQFVLDERRAASVAVVGDFNSWDASANPMARDSASGAWTALVNVKPGRHVYAFLVDGKEWTLDPRAQRTRDVDYGTEQSVVIVGLR